MPSRNHWHVIEKVSKYFVWTSFFVHSCKENIIMIIYTKEKQLSRFEVQIIDKPMFGATKQDILDNISGKFGLLFSTTSIPIDEDVIIAAGRYISICRVKCVSVYDYN